MKEGKNYIVQISRYAGSSADGWRALRSEQKKKNKLTVEQRRLRSYDEGGP